MQRLENQADYLAATEIIDWHHHDVRLLAEELAGGERDHELVARRCFEWVRDSIQHCADFGRSELTCRASDVLAQGTGFCYAKSHLLAALLRANSIPAGFCYQRLSVDGVGPPFCAHGLNAVWLPPYGWYRIDSRGNKAGVTARFTPPIERLAFAIQLPGEFDLPGVLAAPLPQVVNALGRYRRAEELADDLPDLAASATT